MRSMDKISGAKVTLINQTIKSGVFGLEYVKQLPGENEFRILGFEFLKKSSEFDNHNFAVSVTDPGTGLNSYIVIHRGGYSNPAFGATRFWYYETEQAALDDALRLSRLMSYKSALAGVNYGGAKGVIMHRDEKNGYKTNRLSLLKKYAETVNQLNGCFITGTDVGLYQEDVRVMSKYSPYFVGNTIDPTYYTAKGLFSGIKECLKKAFNDEDISGRSFAVQGIGKIGSALVKLIYPFASQIYIADIDDEKVKILKRAYPKIKIASHKLIHTQNVDVFSPCAMNHTLNKITVPEIRSRIIAGGANNQLDNLKTGELIHKMGIIYAPDYAINAGGLISVVDEYEYEDRDEKRIAMRYGCIRDNLKKIFEKSEKQNRPTNIIADEMARNIFDKFQ